MYQSRIGDYSFGHWVGIFYFPPVPLVEGSSDTFSCGVSACRVGDSASEHIAYIFGVVPFPSFKHKPVAVTGAPCTLINGKPAFRVSDTYSCGDMQADGCEFHNVSDVCNPS